MALGYMIKEGFIGLRRAALSTFISILTIILALTLLSVFFILSSNLTRLVEDLRSRVELEVFLDKSISEKQVRIIGEKIKQIPGVLSAQYISKEEAARILNRLMGETDVFDLIGYNPLPASYKIKLKEEYRNYASLEKIAPQIEMIEGIEEVSYQKELLKALDERVNAYRRTALAIGLGMGLIAVLLVSNTIKLSIYARRDLIKTMKLVGATNRFIGAPFLIGGLVQGMTGGLLAGAGAYGIYRAADEWIVSGLYFDPIIPVAFVVIGASMGLAGSLISVRFFLRERIQDN